MRWKYDCRRSADIEADALAQGLVRGVTTSVDDGPFEPGANAWVDAHGRAVFVEVETDIDLVWIRREE